MLLALIGCSPVAPIECTASLDAEEPTVVHVTWDAEDDAVVHVAYSADGLALTTPDVDTPAGPVDVPLYGLAALQDVSFEAHAVTDAGEAICSGSLRTNGLPAGAPDLDVVVDTSTNPRFDWLLGTAWSATGASSVWIVDRAGEVVWLQVYDAATEAFDALVAPDGDGILANRFSADHGVDVGEIRRFALTGEETADYTTPNGHHFFTQLPDDAPDGAGGTFVYLAVDFRDWTDPESGETVQVAGDDLVELAADGTLRTVFSTWDTFDVTEGLDWDDEFYPGAYDWTHANSIHYDAAADAYLLSLDGLNLVLELDRATGTILRSFGSTAVFDDTFVPDVDSPKFAHQHDVVLDGSTLRMFATVDAHSGGIAYTLDDTTHTLHATTEVGFDVGYTTFALGQFTPLDDSGAALVNYGTSGVVAEVEASGAVVWQLETDEGTLFANVHPFAGFYP